MSQLKESIRREEFIKQIFTKTIPFFLLFFALFLSFYIYNSTDTLNLGQKLSLMFSVVVIFGYPIIKIYYGPKVWSILPSAYKPLILVFKIIGTVLQFCFWIVLYLYMPLLLLILCISLVFENNRLQQRLKVLENT